MGGIIGKKGAVIQEITERSEVQSANVKDDSVVFVGMAVSGSTLEPKSVCRAPCAPLNAIPAHYT